MVVKGVVAISLAVRLVETPTNDRRRYLDELLGEFEQTSCWSCDTLVIAAISSFQVQRFAPPTDGPVGRWSPFNNTSSFLDSSGEDDGLSPVEGGRERTRNGEVRQGYTAAADGT